MKTPFAAHFLLSAKLSPQTQEEEWYMPRVLYSSAVQSIMYALVCIHTDISHVVSVASGICINLKRQIVKWILRYLRGTIGIALMYHKDSEKGSELVSYSD